MTKNPDGTLTFDNEYDVADFVATAINQAQAWQATAERLDDAHKYVHRYMGVAGWGKNVFHTILDDALRMRKENEAHQAAKVPYPKTHRGVQDAEETTTPPEEA